MLQSTLSVVKRDGKTHQPFDSHKIRRAVRRAWTEATGVEPSPYEVASVSDFVDVAIASRAAADVAVGVEAIQDAVEIALMRADRYAVAKAYILYRQQRAEARAARKAPDRAAAADYIHASKYARWRPELGRREVYGETVARVEDMHLRRFAHVPDLDGAIRQAFDAVRTKRVLPSMRTMQFGGAAVEACHNRAYNCTGSLVDRPRVFAEALYLLLCGCGVGYSVQFEHVAKLPPLVAEIDRRRVVHHVVEDTIEGWANALDALIDSYVTHGGNVEFSYHKIRPAGSPLRTSGGRAPGHLKLKDALDRTRGVLDGALGRRLRPIECHRIMCHAADAVLSGGIRRSAMLALFSLDDGEMMHSKADSSWFRREPWFANANNSVALKRDEVTERQYRRIFDATRHYGEPGIIFVSRYNHVTNPCGEAGLDPILHLPDGTTATGWSMCNLTEMNAAMFADLHDFRQATWAATVIGTLQADYTSFPYLGPVSEAIVRRDALLGVSMTGMQHAPAVALDPGFQREMAAYAVEVNAEYAAKIGINPAARVTMVKPGGTGTMELNLDCSGIHRAHARRFIRRVTADELEVPFQAFRAANPHMCVRKPDGKWVIEFPREVDEATLLKQDQSAAEFLDDVISTQQAWVLPGTTRESPEPGLRHNVSNTIQVRPAEWDTVAGYIWQHRDVLTGVSLLPDDGDVIYPFAPFEAVKTPAQEARWNELVAHYQPVDYHAMLEAEDGTALAGEASCAGGACEVKL